MTQQIDPETLSTEELTRLANEELGQARDDQGRFVSHQVTPQATPAGGTDIDNPAEEVDEIVYRRVIDLGDGSGTQVFEAPSMEELIDKLADAQTHATRKIREQAAALKPAVAKEETLNEDEEFVLSQQQIQSPTKAFREQFKRNFGMTIEEFKAQQAETAAEARSRRDERLGREFALSHPEFQQFYNDKNGLRVEKWLRLEGLEFNNENVEKAFVELSSSGLLETVSQNQDAEPKTRAEEPTRIAETTTRIVGQRRAASGLSSQGGRPVVKATEPTVEDMYKMSYEELAQRANSATQ